LRRPKLLAIKESSAPGRRSKENVMVSDIAQNKLLQKLKQWYKTLLRRVDSEVKNIDYIFKIFYF